MNTLPLDYSDLNMMDINSFTGPDKMIIDNTLQNLPDSEVDIF